MSVNLKSMTKQQRRAIRHDTGAAIVIATPGSGKCVTGDTVIITSNGLMPIRCIYEQDIEGLKVLAYEREFLGESLFSWIEPSHVFDMGESQTLRLTTTKDTSIVGTPEHPLLVCETNGDLVYRQLKDIRPGISIARVGHMSGSGFVMLERVKSVEDAGQQNVYDLTVPDAHSYVGNGFVNHNTRVITYRIATLISNGVRPSEILAVTFTNKASAEMKDRVKTLVGKMARNIWVSTFHSMCVTMLKADSIYFKVPKKFIISDQDSSKQVMTQAVASAYDQKVEDVEPEDVTEMVSKITGFKQKVLVPRDIDGGVAKRVYLKYEKLLRKNNLLDFDDLMLRVVLAFRSNNDLRLKWASQFRYMLVDEYQDTNAIQYELIEHLVSVHGNPFVVGDDDQAIYGFRGADVTNLDRYKKSMRAKLYVLDRNFRSTANITGAANSVIVHNTRFIEKTLTPVKGEGSKVRWMRCDNEDHQARLITNEISALGMHDPKVYEKIAVLYRTNVQSRRVSDKMTGRGIPHRILGALTFYQRSIIKDILAYLQIIYNPRNDLAFTRIYNKPARGIGKIGFAQFCQSVAEESEDQDKDLSMVRALGLRCYKDRIATQPANGFRQLRAVFGHLHDHDQSKVTPIIDEIISTTRIREINQELMKKTRSPKQEAKYQDIIQNIDELSVVASEFDESPDTGVEGFLEYVALMQSNDIAKKEDDPNRVTLMTCHRAKGTEFQHIYLIGCVEGLFPMMMRDKDFSLPAKMTNNPDKYQDEIHQLHEQHDLTRTEEERRVFFVGMTRAEDHLTMLSPSMRKFGQGGDSPTTVSRFVREAEESGNVVRIGDRYGHR